MSEPAGSECVLERDGAFLVGYGTRVYMTVGGRRVEMVLVGPTESIVQHATSELLGRQADTNLITPCAIQPM